MRPTRGKPASPYFEMKHPKQIGRKAAAAVTLAAIIVFAALVLRSRFSQPAQAKPAETPLSSSNAPQADAFVDLAPSQLNAIKTEPVGTHLFPVDREAVGSIAFVDDLSVQVFPPYQGKLIQTFVELGDQVRKGQPLYTIDQNCGHAQD
jgi:multidrug efflux pump subunit AcrA (membrane-fusion protein)